MNEEQYICQDCGADKAQYIIKERLPRSLEYIEVALCKQCYHKQQQLTTTVRNSWNEIKRKRGLI